jgi:hypothetical protein
VAQIRRDLTGLPTASTDAGGRPPDRDPWVGRTLATAWLDKRYVADKAHAIDGTRMRMSMAGQCTRAIAYYVAGVPESDPPDEADVWRMQLGTEVHELLQAAMVDAFPGAQIELRVGLEELSTSGHIDVVVRTPIDGGTRTTSIEVKTVNGFGFKMAATNFNGPPEGPRRQHLAQAALQARAIDADEMIIAYVSLENVSPQLARYATTPVFGRFTAQWTYTRDEYMAIFDTEAKRIRYVLDKVPTGDEATMAADAAKVPPFIQHAGGSHARIHPPASGGWIQEADGQIIDAGKTWVCDYCRWRAQCNSDG